MKCAYKRELMRMRVEQYNEEERDAVLHVQCLVLRWLADKQGWGRKRLQRFANQALFGLSENFQRMRSEEDDEYDVRTVPFLLKNLEINMEAVLPDFKQIESDYQFAKPKCRDRDKRMYRYMRLQDREAAVKIYWYRYMILLSMEYGFGKKRLDLLYRTTREMYRMVWSYYLNDTPFMDKICRDMLKREIKVVTDVLKVKPRGDDKFIDDDGNEIEVERVQLDINEKH